MSTILFFTSDRLAFANVSPTATTEKVLLVPDPVTGNRLFIGNSTMVGYDGRCNLSSFDGSKATLTIDTMYNRLGIGISSPTSALHVVDATGLTVAGPVNFTGTTTLTGPTNIIGTITASYFTGSAINLTSIPAARIVGTLPASAYGNATIPITALSGYNSGNLTISGTLTMDTIGITDSLSVNIISTSFIGAQEGNFNLVSSGNALIDTLGSRSLSTAFGFISTLTVGFLFAGNISSGSIGSLATSGGSFSSISAGTATAGTINVQTLSTGAGTFSSLTVGSLFAGSISSGSIGSLTTSGGAFSSISAGTATAGIANITSLSAGTITASSLTVGMAFASTINALAGNFSSISSGVSYVGFETVSSFSVGTINAGNVTANSLSSFIVYTSSVHTPNIYVTNIYANDGGIANVVASSLNASKAVFIQVIASSFQGTLLGRNVLQVQGL